MTGCDLCLSRTALRTHSLGCTCSCHNWMANRYNDATDEWEWPLAITLLVPIIAFLLLVWFFGA